MTGAASGPVVFASDGSKLAKTAIADVAGQLNQRREALLVRVRQPFNVRFLPPDELRIDAAAGDEVSVAAEQTVAQAAPLAEAPGFRARSLAIEAAPTWSGIVEAADDHDATVIVRLAQRAPASRSVLIGSVVEAPRPTRDGPCSSRIATAKA